MHVVATKTIDMATFGKTFRLFLSNILKIATGKAQRKLVAENMKSAA